MGRIKELDGLRAVAVLGVFAVHFVPPSISLGTPLNLGWMGVDLFFAISGFLITGILIDLRERQAGFKTFYGRRTLRIFPPYYITLGLILVLALVHAEQVDYREIGRHALFVSSLMPGFIKVAARRLLLQSPPASLPQFPHIVYSPLQFKDCFGIYWSLSVEELFYLVWAPILLKGSRRVVFFFSIAPLLACPVLRGLAHSTPHIGESMGFVFRFDSLAAGSCVALLSRATDRSYATKKVLDRGLIVALSVASLGLVFLATVCGAWRGVDVRTTWTFSVFGFSFLAMLCASLVGVCARWSGTLGFVSSLLRSKSAVYLGTISYAMYLIHLPAFVVSQLVLRKVFGADAIVSRGVAVILCGLLATLFTIGLASLSWKYLEASTLRLKDMLFPTRGVTRAVLVENEGDRSAHLFA